MSIEHHDQQGGPRLPDGRFEGPLAFQQVVRDALACAEREGWRQLILCDPDFEDWPLGERAMAESLQAWSARGRQVTLLACRWDRVVRRHARFVAWRRTWSHIVEARACAQADPGELPSAIWTPGWIMQRHDIERCTGLATHDPVRRHGLHEQLTHWLALSTPGLSATTLGL